jgi:cytochrome c-type biogenesis protein
MLIQSVSFTAAFGAGILSFLSPCILPLIPAYFTFITGLTLDELTRDHNRSAHLKLILATLFYVAGFSLVFIAFGAAISVMGHQVSEYRDIVRMAGGFIVVLLGVHMAGIIRIPGLDYDKHLHITKKPVHLMGTFFVGMAFGAGWSPCVGPLLGTILALAAEKGSLGYGTALLAAYSLGLAIPFILLSVFINYLLVFLKKTTKAVRFVTVASGVFMIVLGLVLIFGNLNSLTFIS